MRFSILFAVATPVLLGCVDVVFALSSSQCKPVAKTCASSAREAAPCTAFFIKNKVKRPTCTLVPAAVTVTKRVIPTSTSIKTITHTVTTVATVSLPTVFITKVLEAVAVESSVTSVTIYTTEIETTTSYTTTTSTPDYNWICPKRKRDILLTAEVEGLVKRTAIPKCCGCFLTSTKTAARQTKIVTTTLPKVTVTKTTTKTTTVTSVTTGIASFSLIYKFTTETFTAIETAFETSTETTTETAHATQTVIADGCAQPYVFNGRNAFAYRNTAAVNTASTVNSLPDCCSLCYNTENCANYMFDNNTNVCTIYQTTDASQAETRCSLALCPKGRVSGSFNGKPENELYGPGPCGGGIVR